MKKTNNHHPVGSDEKKLFHVCQKKGWAKSIYNQSLPLVDKNDQIKGTASWLVCHSLKPQLHCGFTALVFNQKGKLLLQKRSMKKPLWPGFWDGTSSHPRINETNSQAAERRVQEELGFSCSFSKIDQIRYKAKYKSLGYEWEMCAVLRGKYDGEIKPNLDEVSHYRWISINDLRQEIKSKPKDFAPWFIKIISRLGAKTTDNLDEQFYLVDKNDQVMGKKSRRDCHQDKSLVHRAVVVMVVNDKKELFMQQRSMTKDLYPGAWTLSATGHVSYGDSYEQAAVKEVGEELGLQIKIRDLKRLGKTRVSAQSETEFNTVYLVFDNGPFKPNAEEIQNGRWFSLPDLYKQVRAGKVKISPGAKHILFNQKHTIITNLQKWLEK